MKTMKKDIRANDEVTTYFALESMRLRTSRNKNSFLELSFLDKSGKIRGYLWNTPMMTSQALKEKTIVKVKGIAGKYNDALILTIEKIRQANPEEYDINDFMEVVPGGIQYWRDRMISLVGQVKEANCRRVIDSFLEDETFMERFTQAPGGVSIHHGYVGGLLEHTAMLMGQGLLLTDMHPGILDPDLLLTGAFLHDIGKTRELFWDLGREYTTEGKLVGHIGLGLMMLEEKLQSLKGFPKDLALLLRHLLLSHHGELSFGSPVRPATPEAVALHMLDNTDAKLNHLYSHLGNGKPEEIWGGFDKVLNTDVYKAKYERKPMKLEEVAA